MDESSLRKELERAYRAIRGFYTAAHAHKLPDDTMLAYHAPTIRAACHFVATGELTNDHNRIIDDSMEK